jgi:hypothetical protein
MDGLLSTFLKIADPFVFLPLWLAASYIYVTLHETGHVIAGIRNGFRILTFSVWPIAIQRRADSWHFRFVGGKLRFAGFVAADPVTSADLRRRMIIFVAGGPIATLITAIAATLLLFLWASSWPPWVRGEFELLAFLAWLSFLLGLVPYTGRFAVSDAARIRTLRRDGPESSRLCAIMLLAAASRSGVRPRDMNPELIAELPGPADGSGDWILASLVRYNALLDTEKPDEAGAVLVSILDSKIRPEIKERLLLQAAWFEAKFRHDLQAAKQWMAAVPPKNHRDGGYRNTLLRAQAGVAFLEGRLDDAEKLARESLVYCDRIDDVGAVITIRERTQELLAEIAAAR